MVTTEADPPDAAAPSANRLGSLRVRSGSDQAELLDPEGKALFAVNDLAREALGFIADTGAFYVRELPGDLTDEEKVALVSTLMQCRILRSAP